MVEDLIVQDNTREARGARREARGARREARGARREARGARREAVLRLLDGAVVQWLHRFVPDCGGLSAALPVL